MEEQRGRGILSVPQGVETRDRATRVSQVRPGQDPSTRSVQPVEEIHKTAMETLFTTQIGVTTLFYSAQSWVEITLRLETAGPVSVGTREDLTPVLSGKGTLLGDEDLTVTLAKGNRLFYAAEAVNRVRLVVEPFAYGRELVDNQREYIRNQGGIIQEIGQTRSLLGGVMGKLVGAARTTTGYIPFRGNRR